VDVALFEQIEAVAMLVVRRVLFGMVIIGSSVDPSAAFCGVFRKRIGPAPG
jgi:hypothetical protein